MTKELSELTEIEIQNVVRAAFCKAFDAKFGYFSLPYCKFRLIRLANYIRPANYKDFQEAKQYFQLEIFHCLDVQFIEEEIKNCYTLMDLYNAVKAALNRTIKKDAKAAKRSKCFF